MDPRAAEAEREEARQSLRERGAELLRRSADVNLEEDSHPAYRYGWESAAKPDYAGKRFEDVESDLGRGWERARGASRHTWEEAKMATRDAWYHVRGKDKP